MIVKIANAVFTAIGRKDLSFFDLRGLSPCSFEIFYCLQSYFQSYVYFDLILPKSNNFALTLHFSSFHNFMAGDINVLAHD